MIRRVITAVVIAVMPFIAGSVFASAASASTASPPLITCTLTAQNPHKSTHAPGMINFVATAKCSASVPKLTLGVDLWNNNTSPPVLEASHTGSNTNLATISGNIAAACSNGTFYGTAALDFVSPPGYVPASGTIITDSNLVTITC